jgi:hypothetical protein
MQGFFFSKSRRNGHKQLHSDASGYVLSHTLSAERPDNTIISEWSSQKKGMIVIKQVCQYIRARLTNSEGTQLALLGETKMEVIPLLQRPVHRQELESVLPKVHAMQKAAVCVTSAAAGVGLRAALEWSFAGPSSSQAAMLCLALAV